MDALQQLNLAAPITDTYTRIESMILMHIAEQLSGNPQGLINNSSEWRIQMLARMGRLSKDTAKIIAKNCKGIGSEIEAAINASIQSVLQSNGLHMTDKLSENIRSALTMYDRQAISGKYNQVNTVMQYKAKQAYRNGVDSVVSRFDRIMQKELANKQEHLDVLNANAMAVTLGERSRTQAIRETVEEMSDKGIPAFIDASGREWSPEAYVNMDIRNTVKNAANAAQFASLEELGQDIVLVSSHAGARPLCAPFQGKLYSLSGKSGTIRDARGRVYTYEPWSSTSYGEAAGLLGINCGHSIRGVSDGMFINREKQYSEKENSEEYEKVVKQRELERKIRKQKTTRNALKAAGDDEGVKEYDRKIRESNAKLDAYCKENGLTNRRDRTEVYGYSDMSRKKTLDKSAESGIIKAGNDNKKENDKMDNDEVVSAQSASNKRKTADIIRRGIELDRPIFADGAFGEYASHIPSEEKFYDVAAHGTTKTVEFFGDPIDDRTLAKIIQGRKDYPGGNIRLLSCNTAKVDANGDCFAKRLAKTMGVNVKAPTKTLWAFPPDKNGISEFRIGTTANSKDGDFVTYTPKGEII